MLLIVVREKKEHKDESGSERDWRMEKGGFEVAIVEKETSDRVFLARVRAAREEPWAGPSLPGWIM